MANILWVEDEAQKISGLVRPLIKEGHNIIVANDKKDSLNKLTSHNNLDLIILDIIIPSGNDVHINNIKIYEGLELLKHMKQVLKINIPIIVLTIVKDEEALNEIKNLGVEKILRKGSYLPSDLKAEVYKTLGLNK